MQDEQATHDALAETGGPEPDPFAEVPSDPLGEGAAPPPPPPPEGGHIPVSEPDEAQRAAEAEAQRLAEEAEQQAAAAGEAPEFLEEPAEDDALGEGGIESPPVEEEPEPTPEPEPEAPAEPEPAGEPVPEPEPPVEEPTSPPAEPEAGPEGTTGPEEPAPGAETGEEVPTGVETSGSPPSGENPGSGESEGEPESGTPEEPEAEAAAGESGDDKPKPKRKRRRSRKKDMKGRRGYVILKLSDATYQSSGGPIWEEAFEREIPIGEEGSEPVVIDSRSAEMALRLAYRQLTDNGEGSFDLVPVPVKLFRPRKVEGKVPETALAIKVG